MVLRNHFPRPIVNLLHKDKELLVLRNNFRLTKKFLITKFDCSTFVFTERKKEIMNETTAGVEAGLDYYNFTNGSSLWFDNSTALSEEERIIQQKLNSSFGAWLVFMEMSLGQRICQNSFYYSIILSKVK